MWWQVDIERVTHDTEWVEARTQPEACEKAAQLSALRHDADEHRVVSWKPFEGKQQQQERSVYHNFDGGRGRGRRILSEAGMAKLHEMRAQGHGTESIAKELGVGRTTIRTYLKSEQ